MQGPNEGPIFENETQQNPLIVYFHGVGGHPTHHRLNFLIDLARHGYIVMALYHGDHRFPTAGVNQFNLRPLAVKTAIDEILADSNLGAHIDALRIGGATMMALLGAKKVNPHPHKA
jgi:predicted dienelactone hydrolase